MKYTVETNQGPVEVSYVNPSMENIQFGDLVIPSKEFFSFCGELIRAPNKKKSLCIDGKIINCEIEYPKMFGPKNVRFGEDVF